MFSNESTPTIGVVITDLTSVNSILPVVRSAFHMHYRDDPNVVWFVEIDDSMGKGPSEVPACRRGKAMEPLGRITDLSNQPFHLEIESNPEIAINRSIVSNGF